MPPAPRRMLVTVAHPDDETFGMGSTIAHYAAVGAQVHVACATRGEAGEIAPGCDATPESLGQIREAELRAAADALGVARIHLLGYRDSGMAPAVDNPDPNAFINVPEADVIARLTRLVRDVRPHVVVTMPLDGGTGHPDHIRVCLLSTKAFKLAAHPGYIEPGGITHAPSKLYYKYYPRQRMKAFRDAVMAGRPGMPTTGGPGADDEPVSAEIDVSDALQARLKAIACHASQGSPFDGIPAELLPEVLGTDYFVRAIPSWPGGEPERDLFAGL